MNDIIGTMPQPIGLSKPEEVENDSRIQLEVQKISKAATLNDLAKDYTFFNHGIFMVRGGLTFDPVALFARANSGITMPFIINSDQKLFDGIGEWDYKLVAVENKHWPRLEKYLDATSVINRDYKIYTRALKQIMPVVDVFALAKHQILPSTVPMVEVTLYGLDGNNYCMHFSPPNFPEGIVRLNVDKPLPETITIAKRLFNNDTKQVVNALDRSAK